MIDELREAEFVEKSSRVAARSRRAVMCKARARPFVVERQRARAPAGKRDASAVRQQRHCERQYPELPEDAQLARESAHEVLLCGAVVGVGAAAGATTVADADVVSAAGHACGSRT